MAVGPAVRAALRTILAPDYRLYNHFLAKFLERLDQFGSARLTAELAELRAANKRLADRCGFQMADNKGSCNNIVYWKNPF